eukprot:248072-Chlamydomonas_euryale.AAC.1
MRVWPGRGMDRRGGERGEGCRPRRRRSPPRECGIGRDGAKGKGPSKIEGVECEGKEADCGTGWAAERLLA